MKYKAVSTQLNIVMSYVSNTRQSYCTIFTTFHCHWHSAYQWWPTYSQWRT